eukprot:scaffold48310_cov35-Prasinocladus_malaysianus.AAC.1
MAYHGSQHWYEYVVGHASSYDSRNSYSYEYWYVVALMATLRVLVRVATKRTIASSRLDGSQTRRNHFFKTATKDNRGVTAK